MSIHHLEDLIRGSRMLSQQVYMGRRRCILAKETFSSLQNIEGPTFVYWLQI
jgi:hypothetical protein